MRGDGREATCWPWRDVTSSPPPPDTEHCEGNVRTGGPRAHEGPAHRRATNTGGPRAREGHQHGRVMRTQGPRAREGHAHTGGPHTRSGHRPPPAQRGHAGSLIGRLPLPWSDVTSSTDRMVPKSGLTELPAGLCGDRQADRLLEIEGPAWGPRPPGSRDRGLPPPTGSPPGLPLPRLSQEEGLGKCATFPEAKI